MFSGYDEATAQFILKKFLLLVMFLDRAKRSRLIQHDPCLFCVDSEFKVLNSLQSIFSLNLNSILNSLFVFLQYKCVSSCMFGCGMLIFPGEPRFTSCVFSRLPEW